MTVEQQLRAIVQARVGYSDADLARFSDAQILTIVQRLVQLAPDPLPPLGRDV